ncbi:MAG TPA: efflux RND transporter periplasmic adaptor subunit [Candidatus Eisenbacteria bacterium]|nr:efflux RND transporter periplasmic adaptor subunit [Candidatus Eisenbacteria bacterium]
MKRLFILTLLACGAGLGWYLHRPGDDSPQFQTSVVSRGELVQMVTASGQLNPVTKVEVGSQISGIIQKLLVDFNAHVKTGQLIAQLEPSTYEANLMQAEGNLASAKAAFELAQVNADRAKALQADKLNAKADYDQAVASLHQAGASVKINEGALKKAQVDLARCTILAPIDGIVISRDVNEGQTVAASLSAPKLFVIANDLSKMQIEADVAEADIGIVEVGQDVEFIVDAYQGQTFHGKVSQIRNAPKADQTVVTYVTVIEVQNPGLKLKPGMTANVSIVVARRENALKIPNAVFRFRPPKTAEPTKALVAAGVLETTSKSTSKSASRGAKKDKRKAERTVYVLSSNNSSTNGVATAAPDPVKIKTGITDGNSTEVLEGLKEGDEVITSMTAPAKITLSQAASILTGRKR